MLPRNGFATISVAALLYWAALVFVSPGTAASIYIWGFYWSLFVIVWACIKVLDSPRRLMIVLRTVLFVNILQVSYGMSQLAGVDILVNLGLIPDWGSNVYVSTHGSPNFYSAYLIVTIPLLIGYWFLTSNTMLQYFLPALVLVNLFALVKTTARGAYMGMAWYLIVYPMVLIFGKIKFSIVADYDWKRILFRAAIILIVVVLIISLTAKNEASNVRVQIYQQFYTFVDFEANYTNWIRITFFQMGIDGALRAPLFGRGLGTFNHQMPETRPVWYHRTGVSHNTDHPHNEHIEWLHDTGIIGLSFFWTILAVIACLGMRAVRKHKGSVFFPFVASAFLAPWTECWQSTFDVESRWTSPAVALWFGVGIILAATNFPRLKSRAELATASAESRPLRFEYTGSWYLPAIIIACVIPMFIFCRMSRNFWMADHHLRNNMAYTDANQGSIHAAIAEAEQARKLCYTNMSNYYKLAYTWIVAGKLDHAMNAYRDLQSFAPNYAQIHLNLAFLDDQMGFRTASAWERDRAATIEHNTKNHRDAAQYWLQLGYSSRALAHIRHCFTIELDRLENGYYFWYDQDNLRAELARIYMGLGQRRNAENELDQALQLNPNNVLAAVLLTQLYTERQDHDRASELEATLQKHAPSNPALLVLKMSRAVAAMEFDTALLYAEAAASALPLPPAGSQPSLEAANLGNSLLGMMQVIYAANHDQRRCLAISGWIYATQGRYGEGIQFLENAYARTGDPHTGDRLAQARARISK